MHRLILWIGFLLLVVVCSTQKGLVKVNSVDLGNVAEDSLEYDIETFDAKFESWYLLQKSPAKFRSQQYYESWNRQYVSAWNYNATSGHKSSFFEPILGYEPNVDYGFDLNHELFYYFQYVEHVLKIKIMPGGPQTGLF